MKYYRIVLTNQDNEEVANDTLLWSETAKVSVYNRVVRYLKREGKHPSEFNVRCVTYDTAVNLFTIDDEWTATVAKQLALDFQ